VFRIPLASLKQNYSSKHITEDVYSHHINCLPLQLFYMFTMSGFCYTSWHWISIFRVFLSLSYSNVFTFLGNNSFYSAFKMYILNCDVFQIISFKMSADRLLDTHTHGNYKT